MNKLSFKTSIGWISLTEKKNLINSAKVGKEKNKGKNAILYKLKKQIIEFTEGKRKKFSIKLNIEGTILQKKIWKQLINIKYGSTKNYGEIAKILNN